MDLLLLVMLLVIGFLLVLAEVFFVPGTTFVGIIGLLLLGGAVWHGYVNYGELIGTAVLAGSTIVVVSATIYGFNSGAWERYSHKEKITGRVNLLEENIVNPGDLGVAVSDIRPGGKARIRELLLEVRSKGSFIDSGTPIEVKKVTGNTIFVDVAPANEGTRSGAEEA